MLILLRVLAKILTILVFIFVGKVVNAQCNPDSNYRVQLIGVDQNCPNMDDGSITASVVSGSPNYLYKLIELPSGNTIDSSNRTSSTSHIFDSIAVGQYRVSVWDSCNRIQSRDIRIGATQRSTTLANVYLSATSTGYSCDSVYVNHANYYTSTVQEFPVFFTLRNAADTNIIYINNLRIDSTFELVNSLLPRLHPRMGNLSSNQYLFQLTNECGLEREYTGGFAYVQMSLYEQQSTEDSCRKDFGLNVYPQARYFSDEFLKANYRFKVEIEQDTNSGAYYTYYDTTQSYRFYNQVFPRDSILVYDGVRDTFISKSVRVTFTDSCGNSDTIIRRIIPQLKQFYISQNNGSCNDSTANMSIYVRNGNPPYTIILDSGPAYYSSGVHNIDSLHFQYPDTIVTNSNQLTNLPLGHYKVRFSDYCGFQIDTSIILQNRNFNYTVTPVQGCLGSHQINFREEYDSFNNSGMYLSNISLWKIRPGSSDSLMQSLGTNYVTDMNLFYNNVEPGNYRYSYRANYYWLGSVSDINLMPCYAYEDTLTLSPYIQPQIDSASIYQCSPGDSANVLFSTSAGLGPFNYDFFTDSNLYFGPFQNDSLVFINNMFNTWGYDTMLLRVTDQCGNARVKTSVVYIDSCDSFQFILPLSTVVLQGKWTSLEDYLVQWKSLSSEQPVRYQLYYLDKSGLWKEWNTGENTLAKGIYDWNSKVISNIPRNETISFKIKAIFVNKSDQWSNIISTEIGAQESDFLVFPSPSNGQFIVASKFKMPSKTKAIVYNQSGQQLKKTELRFIEKNGSYQAVISFTKFENGVYFLRLQNEVIRFVIVK